MAVPAPSPPSPPRVPAARAALLAILLAASLTHAQSPPPPAAQDLARQIQELQHQVNQLQRAANAAAAASPAYTARDVDATVASVRRDADRHSHVLADPAGFYGGFLDDKFQFRSADGNFTLSPNIWFQLRHDTNHRRPVSGSSGGDDKTDSGFEIRRAKLGFEGNAWGKDLFYNFLWATDRRTGNLLLEEAYVRYALGDHLAVKAGQYKELFAQDSAVSSRRKLAVDVSLLNAVLFAGDTFTQGVELDYDDKRALQAHAGLSDGFQSANTDFRDPPANAFDFGVYGRAQYKFFGDWKSYADFTSLGNKRDLLVVGAGADWSQDGDVNVVRHAVDLQWESAGPLAAFATFNGRYTDDPAATRHAWDWGLMLQASYLFNLQWELFGRYDFLQLGAPTPAGRRTYHDATLGINYYVHKHNLKLTLDASWLPSGAPANLDGIGVLANDGAPEFLLRAQFQFFL